MAMDLTTLVERSPFAPPGTVGGEQTQAEVPSTLEFRGVVRDGGGLSFSVFDATANRGYWLREGQDGQAIEVRQYLAQENRLEVVHQGRPLTLELKRAAIQTGAPIPVAGVEGSMPPQGGPGFRGGVDNQNVDANRLEAVAAEVRRRRALRNAARAVESGKTANLPTGPVAVPVAQPAPTN
jgi:hypothetical protein